MFTVIICDKSVINDCTSKYRIYLKPLLDNKDYAFCAWNPQGETLEEAVPELKKIISIKKEWRAIVLADSRAGVFDHTKQNPFDYVDYKKLDKKLHTAKQIKEYRDYVISSADKALSNPVVKLSIWLGGSAVRLRPSAPEKDFLKVKPLSDEYEKTRSEYDNTIADFELSLARAYRYDKLSEKYELGGELFNQPKSVIAIAERSVDTEYLQSATAWQSHTEYNYSNFIEDNLYSNKLRCLVYEIPRVKGQIKESKYFQYLSTIMIIAENEIQSDMLKFGKLYAVNTVIDEQRIEELCNDYIAKLDLTKKKLDELKFCRYLESKKTIDDKQFEKEFESELSVNVSIDDRFDKSLLMCEYSDLGLSKDCPTDEESYWTSQHSDIRKRFNRFLRQPQRCVEKAVDTEFRKQVRIDSEKAKLLTKYQREDIQYKLYEQEQLMLETVTSKIYNKAEYNQKLDEANKVILRGISQRMIKKSTIIAGIIPVVLFLIGFLPLLFSELNNFGTISMSLLLSAFAVFAVAVSVFVMLIIFRKRLVNRFKHFNYEMSGIYSQIIGSLAQFSKYLSYARSIMKDFAIINAHEDKTNDLVNIYHKHEIDIDRSKAKVYMLFADYVNDDYVADESIKAFSYDFDSPITYDYEIPYRRDPIDIEFFQTGHSVSVPVDFVKSIRLRREELYD